MHPDIKKFWEDAGYEVERSARFNEYTAWVIKKVGSRPICVALTYSDGTPSGYWFSLAPKPKYSEDEALRMIKLKAFW